MSKDLAVRLGFVIERWVWGDSLYVPRRISVIR